MKKLTASLKKLVKILNDGEYHSGTDLGHALKISRNAVWKHINHLTDFDIDIESVRNKGYRLKKPLILLDSANIKTQPKIKTTVKLHVLGSIHSTNDYVKSLDKSLSAVLCLAEHQSAGRGRFGRQWYSPFGANIYLSYRCTVNKDASDFAGLSLVISLAVVSALKAYGIDALSVKWPNDILYQHQKLAGILIEMNAESHGLTQVTIGIGLNVNMPTVSNRNLQRSWTSLDQITQTYHDRNLVAAHIINHVLIYMERFIERGFLAFLEEWKALDYLSGKTITLSSNKQEVKGIVAGVNEQGHLLLEQKDAIHAYSAGDTSIAK